MLISISPPTQILHSSVENHMVNHLRGHPGYQRKINATGESGQQRWSLSCSALICFTQCRPHRITRQSSPGVTLYTGTLASGNWANRGYPFFRTLCFCTTGPMSTILARTLGCLFVHLSCFCIHWDFVFMENYGILLYSSELCPSVIKTTSNRMSIVEQLNIDYQTTEY